MKKYGQTYIRILHRPAGTQLDPGQCLFVRTEEADKYIKDGKAMETHPGAKAPTEKKEKMTVAQVKKYVAACDDTEELTTMLEEEQEGEDRKTALDAISERIAELQSQSEE